MSEVVAGQTYTMKKPESWGSLLEASTNAVNPALSYNQQHHAAGQILDAMAEHSEEELEKSRFYGIGLTACRYARILTAPTGREELIARATRAMAERKDMWNGMIVGYDEAKGLKIVQVDGGSFQTLGSSLEEEELLPLRLLNNVLEASVIKNNPDREFIMKQALSGKPATENIVVNTFAGASVVLKTALMHMFKAKTDKHYSNSSLIRDAARPDTIRKLNITTASQVAARLREDELYTLPDWTYMEGYNLAVKRDALPPAPPKRSNVRHVARLRCPAAFVPDLIPLISTALPEIVARTQEEIYQPTLGRRILDLAAR